MVREIFDTDQAFDMLRAVSLNSGRKLRDVAAEVASRSAATTGQIQRCRKRELRL